MALTQIPTKFSELNDRRIGRATAEKFQVHRDDQGRTYFPYYNEHIHLANKIRSPDKDFWAEGDIKHSGLFGQQLFPAGGKYLTLVEGEYDAMAAFELMGSRWPVVSIRSGAEGAAKDVADNFEYLNSFEKIVICFDKDEPKVNPANGQIRYPGQEAAIICAGMFPIGKVKILTLDKAKDANDYLKAGLRDDFNKSWWASPTYMPTGIKLGREMWDEISSPKNYETVLYPWEGLNSQTYGIRLSELVTITAETGVGKSSFLRETIYNIRKERPDSGIGLLFLEEPNSDTALGLMSLEANLPLHLPDVRESVPTEDLRKYYDSVINNDKLCFFDHFGSNDIQEILNKCRHMVNLGCKYIVIDHLSIIVSDQAGDERRLLDEIATRLKTLTVELNIAVICVIHLNRQGQIRGTAGVEQLSNIVLRLVRDRLDENQWRRNVTKVTVEKNRFCGRTGPADYLFFNEYTGRLMSLTEEEIKTYNSGGSEGLKDIW